MKSEIRTIILLSLIALQYLYTFAQDPRGKTASADILSTCDATSRDRVHLDAFAANYFARR